MVMIPIDVGVQVRNQTEAGSHPVRPVGDVFAELPEFQQGQAFRARIQEVLPENTYKAIVAGRLMTLSLPEGAKAGDTLDLVVVGHARQTIVAQRGNASAIPDPMLADNASLSRIGQLIASLLDVDGETLPPVRLSREGPMLARMPADAAEIARDLPPGLARAVAGSGMFYESHQVEWMLGQRSLASLLAEPQGRFSHPALLLSLANPDEGTASSETDETARATASSTEARPAAVGRGPMHEGWNETDDSGFSARQLVIPDELRPLVQRQLEAGASFRLAWQVDLWPNQVMDWEIARERPGAADNPEASDVWNTRLTLILPRLGEIEARLWLGGDVVNIMLTTKDAASGASLEAAIPGLRLSLNGAGLALAGAQVKHDESA